MALFPEIASTFLIDQYLKVFDKPLTCRSQRNTVENT